MNASIAKTLDAEYFNPADKIRSRYTIVENITGTTKVVKEVKSDVLREFNNGDKD